MVLLQLMLLLVDGWWFDYFILVDVDVDDVIDIGIDDIGTSKYCDNIGALTCQLH